MRESTKGKELREAKGHYDLYLKGHGIDIGAGDDLLQIKEGKVDPWDLVQGDAQFMYGVEDNKYDFVYSSHCLEHTWNVEQTLKNWFRILKPSGYLYLVVPHYLLYEKMRYPSIYNTDHKNTFCSYIQRSQVKRTNHYHIRDLQILFEQMGASLVSWEIEDYNFNYNIGPDIDQTRGSAQAQILLIVEKL